MARQDAALPAIGGRTGWPLGVSAFYLLCVGVAALTLYGENLSSPAGHVRLAATAAWLLLTLAFSWPAVRRPALVLAWGAAVYIARTPPAQDGFLMLTLGMAGASVSPLRVKTFVPAAALVTMAALWHPHGNLTLGEAATVLVNLVWPMVLGYAYHVNAMTGRAQREAIAKLEAANQSLARYAAEADEVAALRARTAMARDLHDTLGHSLSAVTIELEAVRRLVRRAPEEAGRAAAAAQSVARQAMADLRDFVGGLRQESGQPSLARAELEHLATDAARRSGWELQLELADPWPLEAALLVPVLREAITNAERHAHARRVAVTVRWEPEQEKEQEKGEEKGEEKKDDGGQVTGLVEDDGAGFAAEGPASDGHWGLVNMRERMEAAGGTLDVESPVGGGTRLTARLPVRGGGP